MQHPDEGTIHAWIDGELLPDDAAALEAHLTECADCSALVAEARGLAAASSRIVSALDIVPGDVIPKAAPRLRPWYASTQLRAAAAVAIVAGASLLVVRTGGDVKMTRAIQDSAPAAASTPAPVAQPGVSTATPEAIPERARRIADTETSHQTAAEASPRKKIEARAESDQRKEAARDLAAPMPAPMVAQAREPEKVIDAAAPANALAGKVSGAGVQARADSLRRSLFNSSTQLNEVVVTGVASATVPTELKKIRSDSISRQTVYEVSSGVQVTLTDHGQLATIALRASSASSKERQAAAPAPMTPAPPPMADAVAQAVKINSISWIDKRGHTMVLTGPLSKGELEALRQRLPADQR